MTTPTLTPIKRAIIVARVSTAQQAEHGRSIESQLAAMHTYAASIGAIVIDALEDDVSGTVPIRERKGSRALYRYIDDKAADVVIFYAVDRVTRDEDLIEINVIRRDCRQAGIELHYANDGGKADLSTWGGVIDTFKAAGAAEERKKITERNSRGRRAKAESGLWVGAGFAPYGYRRGSKDERIDIVISGDESRIVLMIVAWFLGHSGLPMSPRVIAARLTAENISIPSRDVHGKNSRATAWWRGRGVMGWHHHTVTQILKREIYAGVMRYGSITVERPDLAIIDRETFDAIQARLRLNQEHSPRNRKRNYLLAGRIRCECGLIMTGRHVDRAKRKSHDYYVCSSRSNPKHLRTCVGPFVNAHVIESGVWLWIERLVTDPAALSTALDDLARLAVDELQPKCDDLARIESNIERERRSISVWTAAYPDASDDELIELKANVRAASTRLDTLRRNRDAFAAQIAQVSVGADERREIIQTLGQMQDDIRDADTEDKRYFIDRLGVSCQLRRDDAGLWADITGHLASPVLSIAAIDFGRTCRRLWR